MKLDMKKADYDRDETTKWRNYKQYNFQVFQEVRSEE